jgi:hypothetical protein
MKLNRAKFIDETCGNLDTAMNFIDYLLDLLSNHYTMEAGDIKDSEISEYIEE